MATDPYVGADVVPATMDPYQDHQDHSVWDDETLPGSPMCEKGLLGSPCPDVPPTSCTDVSCLRDQQSLCIMKES